MEQWPVLQRFWSRALNPAFALAAGDQVERWHEEVKELHSLGIAMEAALQFLYFERPAAERFRQWLLDNKKDCDAEETTDAAILSQDDLAFWDVNGYVVLKNAVPQQQCADARAATWEFLRATPDDPHSWYQTHDARRGLMLQFFDHPALHRNRQSARVRNAYRQLYGSSAIHKTIDKVSFNPPEQAGHPFVGSALHWDASLVMPMSFRLQGLLYLTDCGADEGAFHCVPGFHRQIEDWLRSLPPKADPRALAPQLLRAVPIPAKAGDFVIWHQALPHCATPNRGKHPRMVQYLTYLPDADEERKEWK
jgi:hypothetical protein